MFAKFSDTLPDIHNISLTHLALIVKLFDETIESGKMRLESLKSILDVNQSLGTFLIPKMSLTVSIVGFFILYTEDVSEKSTPRDSEKRENDHIDPADLEIGKFMEIIDDKVLDYLARRKSAIFFLRKLLKYFTLLTITLLFRCFKQIKTRRIAFFNQCSDYAKKNLETEAQVQEE